MQSKERPYEVYEGESLLEREGREREGEGGRRQFERRLLPLNSIFRLYQRALYSFPLFLISLDW